MEVIDDAALSDGVAEEREQIRRAAYGERAAHGGAHSEHTKQVGAG